jgi:hypothetical protein
MGLLGLVVAGGLGLLFLIFIFVVMGHLRSIELVLRNIDKNLVEAAAETKKRSQP